MIDLISMVERSPDKGLKLQVDLDHPRLQQITVSDAVDEEKGIDSRISPIEPVFLLVPPHLLGIHEATIGDASDPSLVPEGHDHSGFSEIDFSEGWSGPAIAVAASSEEIYHFLYESTQKGKKMAFFKDFEYGDLGILDGHHRNTSAENGPTKLKYVPVQLIPYPMDKSVILGTWHHDGVCWTAEQVMECFKDPNKVADAKRTKFQIEGKDGNLYRILHLQPNVEIPIEDLM